VTGRTGARAVTESSFGAWLVKASPVALPLPELVRTGFARITSRCVRPSYRTELVREGQPVLFWVSGNEPRHPAGIYAHGHTTGPVHTPGGEAVMPVRLLGVAPAVSREEILAVPGLSGLEVLRMPAGSNPSYLDVGQYRTLRQHFPQLSQR
jgi:hypothetical protein